jgi:ACT domain
MSEPSRPNTARLLISCPDRRGIVAAVSQFLFSHGANIIASDQHSTDPEGGRFFMRQEFHLEGLDLTKAQFERAFQEVVAEPFGMEWKLWYSSEPKRMAILASKYDHCLLDLLWRVRRGEFDCVVPLVISNHADLEADVRSFGIPFHHVPVVGGETQRRFYCAGPIHADYFARFPRACLDAGDQHSPFVFARVRWRKSVQGGFGSRCENHWCNRALRDGRIGCWADHRAGCRARFASG